MVSCPYVRPFVCPLPSVTMNQMRDLSLTLNEHHVTMDHKKLCHFISCH